MKKNIKKIIAGAFVSFFALQTILVSPASAATDMIKCVVQSEAGTGYEFYYNDTWLLAMSRNETDTILTKGYDLSNYASTLNQITGTKHWNFRIDSRYDHMELYSVKMIDNQGNIIKKTDFPSGYVDIGDGYSYSVDFTTNIPRYDLDYDGAVTTYDAQLALNFSIKLASPSNLQTLLGDSNSNGTIDSADAQYILKVALGII